ncbi:MAG: serine hydrolase [Leptolyngbya sp. SIO1D8]|nr:serine hydrolase [Leptolyngbya sp. SIO1D8]
MAVIPVTGSLLVDWRLFLRAVTYPEEPIMEIDWYRPLAKVSGRSSPPLPTSQSTSIPTDALQRVSDYAQKRNSTGLLVMHRGEIVLEEYWQGYDASSVFNAMSMSKTIVGLLVGNAIADGAIDTINDPVAQYIPEWGQDERANITLRDLIYMQSGLRNERETDSPASDLVQMYVGSDVAGVALNIPSVMPSSQTFEYNNVNSQVLALLLQRATGISYADYLSTQLWQPLGASDASVWLDRPQGNAKSFCCLFATIRDWARVGQMLLQQGRVGQTQVIPAEWIQQMLTPSPLEPTFGAHIWIKARTPDYPNVDQAATEAFLATDTFYLDGRDLQRVYVIPSQELVVVRMGEWPETWDDSVIPNILVQALRQR